MEKKSFEERIEEMHRYLMTIADMDEYDRVAGLLEELRKEKEKAEDK